ncbi:Thiopurine S-methyltransferase [Hondaea fermentalgiana]|uniref:Cilia- and flagella-associated protein 300 n=1 Tax=Hondaea fermentalgiana TaxID=2315210 RepID=A0A2R5FZV4_9STRA|nr:Thiopurine S-methyltransferase [Hondaea fermentalgiana]|eukprot:GBG24270.1 Thiopurine S-methyltransferase [Hondaea fermentalgiana]
MEIVAENGGAAAGGASKASRKLVSELNAPGERHQWSFAPVPAQDAGLLADREKQETLMRWGLDKTLILERFRVTSGGNDLEANPEAALLDFFNSPIVQAQLAKARSASQDTRIRVPTGQYQSVQNEPLRTNIVDLSFLRRLKDPEHRLVSDNGHLRKCMDEIHDGATSSTLLTEMLINEESEHADLYTPEEQSELIFRLFRWIAVGGALCQADDNLEPYSDMLRALYKELVHVVKDPDTQQIKDTDEDRDEYEDRDDTLDRELELDAETLRCRRRFRRAVSSSSSNSTFANGLFEGYDFDFLFCAHTGPSDETEIVTFLHDDVGPDRLPDDLQTCEEKATFLHDVEGYAHGTWILREIPLATILAQAIRHPALCHVQDNLLDFAVNAENLEHMRSLQYVRASETTRAKMTLMALSAAARACAKRGASLQGVRAFHGAAGLQNTHTEKWTNMWTEKFQETQPFWHIDAVNKRLLQFKDEFIQHGARHSFLVPLCGKSLDLIWLSQFGFVAGVEISQDAIDQFRAENRLEWDATALEQSDKALFRATVPSTANEVAIAKMDFFNLPPGWSDIGASSRRRKFDRAWDRAALVAIDPPMRSEYVDAFVQQLSNDAVVLLSSFVYPEGAHAGPPFCVPETEVRALYEPYFHVDLLMQRPIPMDQTEELVFLMKRKC